jgi:hypothetical protein
MLNKTIFRHTFQNSRYANSSVTAAVSLEAGNIRREILLVQSNFIPLTHRYIFLIRVYGPVLLL